jgi:hypothetical protein
MNCRLPRETLGTEDFSSYWITPLVSTKIYLPPQYHWTVPRLRINSSSFDSIFWINLPLRSSLLPDEDTIQKPSDRWTFKIVPSFCLSNFETSFSKLSQYMQCHASNHNTKVSEKRLLIMVNCFSLKISIVQMYFHMFDVIMLFYISLPSWSRITLCSMVDRERFSVFRVDHWVKKSGHPCTTPSYNTVS